MRKNSSTRKKKFISTLLCCAVLLSLFSPFFSEITVNADEDKMIVDVFKEYINTDGKIITSIFDVSNQAALLGGEYDGYRVLFTQKV